MRLFPSLRNRSVSKTALKVKEEELEVRRQRYEEEKKKVEEEMGSLAGSSISAVSGKVRNSGKRFLPRS